MRKFLLGTALAALVSSSAFAQEDDNQCISTATVQTDMASMNMIAVDPGDQELQGMFLASGIQIATENGFDAIPDNVDVYINPNTGSSIIFFFVGGCFNRQYGPVPFEEVIQLLAEAYMRMPQA